ncbi:MAG: hypothetical protein J1F01_02935 [Oscillospiraceae bacterium]|nr:hypothetical protein [Oscillospiraceae bacterium]
MAIANGVYHPNTVLTSGDNAAALPVPNKAKMYLNDIGLGLNNVWLSVLQTADMLQQKTHIYLK